MALAVRRPFVPLRKNNLVGAEACLKGCHAQEKVGDDKLWTIRIGTLQELLLEKVKDSREISW